MCGQVALAVAALPELGRRQLAAVLELLAPEADGQRHHDDVVLLDELVGQVAGTVGDDVDAGHARVCHGGARGGAPRPAGAEGRRVTRSVRAARADVPGRGAGRRPAATMPDGRRRAGSAPGPDAAGRAGAAGAGRTGGTRRRPPVRVVAPAQPDHDGAEGEAAGDHGADDPGHQPGDAGRRREVGHHEDDDAHGHAGDDDADQRRPGLALGQAPEPLVEDGQRQEGRHGVGDGERQREAAHAERMDEQEGQDDVQRVLHQVEVEGDPGALHRLQHAHEVQVGAEAGQAEGEHGQRGAGRRRLGRGAVPVAEQQGDRRAWPATGCRRPRG